MITGIQTNVLRIIMTGPHAKEEMPTSFDPQCSKHKFEVMVGWLNQYRAWFQENKLSQNKHYFHQQTIYMFCHIH
jgi:hypothetical protein